MTPWIVYNAAGRILRSGWVNTSPDIDDDAIAAQAGASETAAAVGGEIDPRSAYVVAGAVYARPACPITGALAARVLTLSGCPVGAAVRIDGDAAFTGTTDAASMVFNLPPGTFFVSVDCFPAQDFTQGYTVT